MTSRRLGVRAAAAIRAADPTQIAHAYFRVLDYTSNYDQHTEPDHSLPESYPT